MSKSILIGAVAIISAPAAAQTTTYQYDALGRLVGSAATANGSSVSTTITYDSAGNRTNYKVTGAAGGGSGGGGGSGNGTGNDPGAGAGAQTERKFVVVPLNGFTLIPIS